MLASSPGLARLRGTECHAPYAEAFTCAKSLILCEVYHAGGCHG